VILTIQKKNEDIEYALINAFATLGYGNLDKVDSETFQDMLTYKGYRLLNKVYRPAGRGIHEGGQSQKRQKFQCSQILQNHK
jgi:hypothetical protein